METWWSSEMFSIPRLPLLSPWFVGPALLVSAFLWLGLSTVFSGVVGEWVRSSVPLHQYGSVSLLYLIAAVLWAAVLSGAVLSGHLAKANSVAIGFAALVVLVVMAALGVAALFAGLQKVELAGAWASNGLYLAYLIAEALVGVWIVAILFSESLSIWLFLRSSLIALAWLAAAKAILLCAVPGITIQAGQLP